MNYLGIELKGISSLFDEKININNWQKINESDLEMNGKHKGIGFIEYAKEKNELYNIYQILSGKYKGKKLLILNFLYLEK